MSFYQPQIDGILKRLDAMAKRHNEAAIGTQGKTPYTELLHWLEATNRDIRSIYDELDKIREDLSNVTPDTLADHLAPTRD